jgi:hypothetical protein
LIWIPLCIKASYSIRQGRILWRGEPPEVDFHAFWRVRPSVARDCRAGIYAGSSVLLDTHRLHSYIFFHALVLLIYNCTYDLVFACFSSLLLFCFLVLVLWFIALVSAFVWLLGPDEHTFYRVFFLWLESPPYNIRTLILI